MKVKSPPWSTKIPTKFNGSPVLSKKAKKEYVGTKYRRVRNKLPQDAALTKIKAYKLLYMVRGSDGGTTCKSVWSNTIVDRKETLLDYTQMYCIVLFMQNRNIDIVYKKQNSTHPHALHSFLLPVPMFYKLPVVMSQTLISATVSPAK